MHVQTQKASVTPNEPAYWSVGHVDFITLCINQTLFIKCFIVHKWVSYNGYAAHLRPYFKWMYGDYQESDYEMYKMFWFNRLEMQV